MEFSAAAPFFHIPSPTLSEIDYKNIAVNLTPTHREKFVYRRGFKKQKFGTKI